MRKWLIEKLGGFPDLDSAIASIKAMDDLKRKHKVLTEAVKHLFNAIGPEDILREEKGVFIFRGKPMTQAESDLLRAEAEQFVGSKLWRVLRMDVRWQLNKKMFIEPNITMDVLWGKLLLFYDDIYKTRLQKLAGKKIDSMV